MYFQGMISASGASLANLQTDIIGLLTGAITTPAQLSSNFQAGAIVINTIAPGWELIDSVAGAVANGVTPKVIRAPYSDDPTKFKHIRINSSTAGQLGFNGYEEWDPIAHTGTNPMQANVTVSGGFQNLVLAANTMIIISASANHFFLSVGPSLIGAATGQLYFTEYSRDDPWNTVANGYPSWLQSGWSNSLVSGAHIAVPRVFDPATSTDKISQVLHSGTVGVMAAVGFIPNGFTTTGFSTQNVGGCGLNGGAGYASVLAVNMNGADANKAPTKYLFDIAVRAINGSACVIGGAFLGGNCSAIAPHVFMCPNNLTLGDTFVVEGLTYQIVGYGVSRQAILME